VPIDNALYDRLAGSWWAEDGFLHVLVGLNPGRFGYMRRVLVEELRLDPSALRALDIGCGGGLLAEEFARLGCRVTGIDPSEPSLAAARDHAAREGLSIEYRHGSGEALPFPDGSFDAAYCCDVLEHVDDLPRVVAETARVLKPGGVYLYDTINRTLRSWLIMIKLFQEWAWTSFMPPDLHEYDRFIRPGELASLMSASGIEPRGLTGLGPRVNPIRAVAILHARKKGKLSYLDAIRRMNLGESPDTSVLYMGYAVRRSAPA
jgi:2-polyprenyl-6-hydroxyphenyl methylase/3-demethylubiquinone-9 3-methyltransferase